MVTPASTVEELLAQLQQERARREQAEARQAELEQELQQQREFYETVLNEMPTPLTVLTPDYRYLFVNPAVEPQAEIREALIGKDNAEACRIRNRPPGQAEQRQSLFEQAVRERRAVSWEESIAYPHGRRYLLRCFQPVFDASGELRLMLSTGYDITERQKAEEKLDEQREFYESILNHLPCDIGIFDHEYRYVYVNELGIKDPAIRAWVIGKNDLEYAAYRNRPREIGEVRFARFDEAVRTRSLVTFEESFLLPEGERRLLRCVQPVFHPDGSLRMLLGYGLDISDRHRAEQKLAEQRQFYEAILTHLPADVAVFDAHHRYAYVNPLAIQNQQVREWIIGKDDFEYCAYRQKPRALAEGRRKLFLQAIQSREEAQWEEAIATPEGPRYLLRRFRPVFDSDGHLLMVVGTGVDITERHLAEDLHRQSEAVIHEQQKFIRQIVDTIPDVLYVVDRQGEVAFSNEAFTAFMERSNYAYVRPDEYPEQAAERQKFQAWNEMVIDQQCVIREEMALNFPSGEVLHYLVDKRPLVRSDGTVEVLTINTDITEIKHIRQNLERNAKQYRDLMQYTQALICTHDLQGNVLSANPALAALLQMPTEQILGLNLAQVMSESRYEEYKKYLANFEHLSEASGILPVTLPVNQERRYLLYHNCLVAEAGQAPYIIAYAQDVTERVLAEKQLERAKQAAEAAVRTRESFLANMSHEIRTPMNAILGMTQLLAQTPLSNVQDNYLQAISTSAENLLVIINDILDLSKLEAGKVALEEVGFVPARLFAQIEKTLQYKAEEKGLSFVTEVSATVPEVLRGDPYRITQVLLNLAGNAIKFTEKGEVRISCGLREQTEEGVEVEFTVVDTGIGIDSEYVADIFEEFTQEDSSITRKFGGTGLGLSISRSLVHLMGGEVMVESKKNSGTRICFTLRLPVGTAADVPERGVPSGVGSLRESLRGKHVLLVEDNRFNRLIARAFLNNANVDVTEAENGALAVEMLRQQAFDLILMDVQMPVMNGFEATRALRQELGLRTPIIALTANAVSGEREKCLEAGMNDYLAKPFHELELLKIVADWSGLAEYRAGEVSDGLLPVATPAGADARLYSVEHLRQLSQGDETFVEFMLQTFLESCEEALDTFGEGLRLQDVGLLKTTAHTLKPSLAHFEAWQVLPPVEQLDAWKGAFCPNTLPGLVSNTEQLLRPVLAQVAQDLDLRRQVEAG
ncbi:hypothetical protein GCM10023185_16340 [Hymenobacter saemangeumensis]|uniref:histidine kinase n=1 Tax=Hymenobacter saemangeumensis TaxID=1084522 RepID=A0ABP8I9U7_9BACT